jgi:hypothetical protein
MPEGVVLNGKVNCPSCGAGGYHIYRRAMQDDDTILCFLRCDKCDYTFTAKFDRGGSPVEPKPDEQDPKLPFEKEI